MFAKNNKLRQIASNTFNALKGIKARSTRRLILAAATAGAIGLSGAAASAAIVDVTGLQTTLLPGISTVVNNVAAYGTPYSGWPTTGHYNMHYAGEIQRVDKVITSGGTYIATGQASAVVRRFSGPNTDIIWYRDSVTGTPTSTDLYLRAAPVGGFNTAFSGNNLLVGTDNLFTNTKNGANNNTNVERLDMLFPSGFTADATKAFAIFDRGKVNAHDGFKIAAITALDGMGNPSNYGPLVSLATGSWGKTDLTGPFHYIVTRRNNAIPGDTWHPSDTGTQSVGGKLFPTSDLVASGTTIYGYSLFPTDVTGSGSQLDNWMNTNIFKTGTTEATGGLDALGTTAVLYTAVPEPSTGLAVLAGVSTLAMLRRRPRRDASAVLA